VRALAALPHVLSQVEEAPLQGVCQVVADLKMCWRLTCLFFFCRMYWFDRADLELSVHNSTQLAVYDICNKAFGHRHQWLAFIDVDEFLVRPPRISMPSAHRHPSVVAAVQASSSDT
jgi:hypothetical protein